MFGIRMLLNCMDTFYVLTLSWLCRGQVLKIKDHYYSYFPQQKDPNISKCCLGLHKDLGHPCIKLCHQMKYRNDSCKILYKNIISSSVQVIVGVSALLITTYQFFPRLMQRFINLPFIPPEWSSSLFMMSYTYIFSFFLSKKMCTHYQSQQTGQKLEAVSQKEQQFQYQPTSQNFGGVNFF